MKKNQLVIYEPNKFARVSPVRLFVEMARDLRSSFGLGWRLFLRDFSAKYRQQLFGVIWAIVNPFMAVIPFVLLARGGIINVSAIDAPYPLYAFLGVAFWGVLQGITVSVASIVNASGPLLAKINFSREALLVSPLMTNMIDFLIKMTIFFLMCAAYGYPITIASIAFVAAIIPAILAGLGLGMFLSIVGAVFKDVVNILGYFFQFLMLLTPILYAKPTSSILGHLSDYNPFYYLVAVPRDLVLTGSKTMLLPYAWCSLGALVLFFVGWRFYKVAMARIVERI